MKFMIILFSLFIASASWSRGPVDPIMPPWPLQTLPLNKYDFPGRWISVTHKTIFVVDIDFNGNGDGCSTIQIRSNANITQLANGLIKEYKGIFIGQVDDGSRILNIMIFRDDQGTKLRIADSRGYFDLKLLKSE
ncbi:MAG: hypothetical protein ACXVCP_01930 [Bdellovibrio sp.]